MHRNTLNFLIDVVTLLAIFAMVATGLLIRFILPPGTGGRHGGHGLELWGMGRHEWGDVHFWVSVILGVLLIIHVALHWSWVCMMVYRLLWGTDNANPFSAFKRNAYGLVFLVALVVIFGVGTWYASTAVLESNAPEDVEDRPQHSGSDESRDGREESHGITHDLIRGSMTLAEVEDTTGVSVATLISELGLPKDIPADERLGRLGRQYGFNLEKVRGVVATHMPQPYK